MVYYDLVFITHDKELHGKRYVFLAPPHSEIKVGQKVEVEHLLKDTSIAYVAAIMENVSDDSETFLAINNMLANSGHKTAKFGRVIGKIEKLDYSYIFALDNSFFLFIIFVPTIFIIKTPLHNITNNIPNFLLSANREDFIHANHMIPIDDPIMSVTVDDSVIDFVSLKSSICNKIYKGQTCCYYYLTISGEIEASIVAIDEISNIDEAILTKDWFCIFNSYEEAEKYLKMRKEKK